MPQGATIVQVAVTYMRAGTEQILLDLTQRLVADGHKVIAVIPRQGTLDLMAAEAANLGAVVRRTGPLYPAKRDKLQNFRMLYQIFRTEQPAIVHFHMPVAPSCFEGIIAAWGARVPYIVRTEHNPIEEMLPFKQRAKMRVLDRMVDRIVFVSTMNRDKHLRNCGRPLEKCRIVPNGVDCSQIISDFSDEYRSHIRRELGLPQGVPLAVMVASLGIRKGTIDFIHAAQVAEKRLSSLHYVLIGDGDARLEAEQLAHKLGIADKVHFLGWRNDVRRLLSAFDLYVQPSHYEGMALTMLEALAAGLPMVTTRVDGVADVLPNEEGALFVDIHDTTALGEAMARLAADPDLCQQLAAVSQERVRTNFTTDILYQRYRELYRSLGALKSSPGSSRRLFSRSRHA